MKTALSCPIDPVEVDDRFKLLVDSMKDYALFMLDVDGKVATWNASAQAMKGYAAEEIIGTHFSRFYTIEDLEQNKPAHVLEVARNTGRYEEEGWRVRKDGTRFWVNVVISAMRDKTGALRGFSKITRDLTERLQTEERQRGVDEQFRMLVERVEEYAIFMLDIDGRVATWNIGAQKIKGYNAEEILGQHFQCFYTAQDRLADKPRWLLAEAMRMGHVHDIGPRVRKDGTTFQCDVVITAIFGQDKQHHGFAEVTRDITEQLRQIEVEKSKTLAEASNKAKDHFLAVLSHELRTPLTPVMASISFLKSLPEISELVSTELDCIHRNMELEVRLIDDLLDMTSIGRAKVKLRQEALDVNALLASTVSMYELEIGRKKLSVIQTLDAAQAFVWGDSARLRQVFCNLLGNAIKFTPNEGTITLHTSNDQSNHVSIEIIDTGLGIATDSLPKIFNAFEQGDREGTHRFGGLGLGLTISKALVELHGGSIHAESRGENLGSTFAIKLNTVAPTRSNAQALEARLKNVKSRRILLVEDHPDTLRVMRQLLLSDGHNVTTATTVREAIQSVEQEDAFDLLVSDIGLPDGSGWDIMSRIKPAKPLKGIALSGFGADDDVRKSFAAGFDDHLVKPVDFVSLQKAIEKVAA